jgi:hypothetical protein
VSRWAKEIETQIGIPTVCVAMDNIVHYATTYVRKYQTGMPIRFVAVPFPFTGQPREVDVNYVTGKDMLTGQPMMAAVVAALTSPLTPEEEMSGAPPEEGVEPRLLEPDTEANLRRLFDEKEWTDYN